MGFKMSLKRGPPNPPPSLSLTSPGPSPGDPLDPAQGKEVRTQPGGTPPSEKIGSAG